MRGEGQFSAQRPSLVLEKEVRAHRTRGSRERWESLGSQVVADREAGSRPCRRGMLPIGARYRDFSGLMGRGEEAEVLCVSAAGSGRQEGSQTFISRQTKEVETIIDWGKKRRSPFGKD